MTIEEALEYINNHYMAYVKRLQDDIEQIERHNNAMDIAIECIEKQMPKKPKVIEEINRHLRCKNCGQHLGIDRYLEHYELYYCPKCGQKWSEQ